MSGLKFLGANSPPKKEGGGKSNLSF